MIQTETLIKKIQGLSTRQQTEVQDFVDFLVQKDDKKFVEAAMKTSEKAFEQVWDNEEDSVYDQL